MKASADPATTPQRRRSRAATRDGRAAAPSLRDAFSQYFEVQRAETAEQVDQVFRLRYQVYCVENPFENPAEHLDGREVDSFDQNAAHALLLHRPTGNVVGAVRLVLPRPEALDKSFPIQQVCDHPVLRDRSLLPLESAGELSRFALSKEFRRRSTDGFYGEPAASFAPAPAEDERRTTPPMRLGLMQGIMRLSAEMGLTHWCAVMEPALLRILRSTSIYFEPLGPLVNFHGMRQPCYGSIRNILLRLRLERPDVWDLVTDGGALWDLWTVSTRAVEPPSLTTD